MNLTKLQQSCLNFSKITGPFQWKDTTSYSRSDSARIPTAFYTKIGDCGITITCGHRDYKPEWVFHCYNLGFDTQYLGKMTAQKAAEKALAMCIEKVNKLYESFNPKINIT